jgi:hypothetical protein
MSELGRGAGANSSNDQTMEFDVQQDDHGFWKIASHLEFSPGVSAKIPRTCKRFYEARHFIELLSRLPVVEDSVDQANWYVGAHLSAVIALRDAGQADFESAKRRESFKFTPLSREFFLESDTSDAFERDPMAINRNYKLLRNERVHRSVDVVALEERVLGVDVSIRQPACKRWFFRRVTPAEHDRISRDPKNHAQDLVTPLELEQFNNYNEKRTLIAVAAQHLVVFHGIIEQTAQRLR